ncbi:PVC-type heme-binding CxxCH protein [uncultured Paraglaciecola sp.]|uniref:PVC-type heme-binding CxxCH protein n=1 Tax=uncultured Paraglaciecola sp. TaxID=1765024 RepID=UPI0030D720EE|tara:strand:- start:32530 stop:34893 length:2364 start_codon:yes stop_codon:yes gene_type:complete
MKNITGWAVCSLCLIVTSSLTMASQDSVKSKNKGDRPGHVMTAPLAPEEIPPAPILTVPQALSSMQIQPGFVLENVAAEPLVASPIDIAFDSDGRIWVAEMLTFMPDLDGNNEELPEGSIAVLQDTDGDGQVDKRTVFLDNVILPRTVSMVKGGILYADQEQLYFAEVLAGDKLGLHEVVDPTYAEGGNIEHKPNGMLYALDNWYYNTKSNRKYRVLNLNAAVPAGAEEIYRNKYWKMVVATTDFRGQWGLSSDDYGRLYHNGNSSPAQGEYLRPGSLMKNPGFQKPVKANNIGTKRVYPARVNPGVNRAYLPNILVAEGDNKGKLASFTAASGNQLYRGDQFPEDFYGVSFTPEPAGNLISARRVVETPGALEGVDIYPQSELLTSTDERFRPVNLNTAPDGSLYIVDMYHGVIQHKEFLTTYLRKQYESRGLDKNNRSMGRIYRLRWKDNALGEQPKMSQQTPAQWVKHLSHSNAWWRDMARQLIVQQGDMSVVPAIKKLLSASEDHRVRINALWTLEGLDALDLSVIETGLTDIHPKVKVSAIELSSHLPVSDHAEVAENLIKLASSGYELGIQVALVAGEVKSPRALLALKQVLIEYADKPWVKEAAISGLAGREEAFKALLTDFENDDFIAMLNRVGQKDLVDSNSLNLPDYERDSYNRGQVIYDGKASCFGCHGKDGKGIDNMGPPLLASEWVTESEHRLAKILLSGLMGPIQVNGTKYNGSMIMPGFSANLTDQELADVSTYIRNNWGNTSSYVSKSVFEALRKETSNRQVPYTEKELQP